MYQAHPTLSATTIKDTDVKNPDGENLGDIKDIMLNTKTGQIEYYVLSFVGFLGLGDKYFAVPSEAVSFDTEEECAVLNVAKEKLKNAPGFDKDNWPNMADGNFRRQIHEYYGYKYRQAA